MSIEWTVTAIRAGGSVMEDKSTWLVWALILAVGGFFAWPLFERMRGEITVYKMFCTTGRVNGQCKFADEQTSVQESFKVFPDQQSVIYWIGDGAPSKYTSCAVRDVSNWRCSYGKPGTGYTEYIMADGNYTEVAEAPFIPTTNLFYPVSRWRWWAMNVKEMWTGKK